MLCKTLPLVFIKMGSAQSSRASHFQRPRESDATGDRMPKAHVNISNKMVERLAEEAKQANDSRSPVSRAELQDNIYIEQLKCLDQTHSQRCKLTIEDLEATVERIQAKTAELLNPDPVCENCRQQVLRCYSERGGGCVDELDAFNTCVRNAAARALQRQRMPPRHGFLQLHPERVR